MAINLYDEAIATLIESWITSDSSQQTIHVMRPNEVAEFFKMTDDQRSDMMLKLPLIMLSRKPEVVIRDNNIQPRTYSGQNVFIKQNGKQVGLLNSVGVDLEYQIDIFTKEFVQGDEYLRDFIFKLINHPSLTIRIPYNANKIQKELSHTFTLSMSNVAEDNSDIPERAFKDQFTRWTLTFKVDDAYLWSLPFKNVPKVKEVVFESITLQKDTEIEEKIDINTPSNH